MDFKGYGNPHGKYWFIGIEEALTIDSDEKLKPYESGISYNTKGDYSKFKNEFYNELKEKGKRGTYTSTYDIAGKIIMNVEGNNEDLTKFLDKNILTENGNNFYTNIYPLGKPKANDKLQKKSLDYMGLSGMEEYRKIVKSDRFKSLSKLWTDSKPDVTICFGKGNWNEFENLLKLDSSKRKEIVKNRIYLHHKSTVYLVPFFSYRKNCIGDIIDELSHDIRNRIP